MKSCTGNQNLGGVDIDNALMKWTIEKIKEEYGVDLSNDSRAKTRIQKECQMAKQLLQQEEYVCHEMQFDVLNQDLDLVELEISREEFEQIC